MEEIRNAVFNEVDIVTTRDYAVIDKLTKIEIQAKVLGLNIIAPESYLTILKMPKKHLIDFILQLNLFYAEENENDMNETQEEMNDMNETEEGMNDDQHGIYGTDNFYGYHGDVNDYQQYWQHNQDQYVNDYYQYSAQDQQYWQQYQWQNGMLFQQWNGQYQNDWNESN